jgi:hypothetical protein
MNIATKIQIIALAIAKIQLGTINKYNTAAPYASIIEAGRSLHMSKEYLESRLLTPFLAFVNSQNYHNKKDTNPKEILYDYARHLYINHSKGTPNLISDIMKRTYHALSYNNVIFSCTAISNSVCDVLNDKTYAYTSHKLSYNLRLLYEIFYIENKDKYGWNFWNSSYKPEFKESRILAIILFHIYLENQFDLYLNRSYLQSLKTRLLTHTTDYLHKPALALDFSEYLLESSHMEHIAGRNY